MISTHTKAYTPQRWLDAGMAVSLLTLLVMGLLLVYSSSSVYADHFYHDPQHFLKLHTMWLLLGLAAFTLGSRVPVAGLRKWIGWVWAGCLLLLLLTLIPGVGHKVGGARRWLVLYRLSLQPAEFTKLVVVIFSAKLLAKPMIWRMPHRLLLINGLAQIPVLLLLLEPDFGGAMVLETVVLCMMLVAGLPLMQLLWLVALALPGLGYLLFKTPFRLQRLLTFLDPWAYRSSSGYQVTEALIGMGAGGLWGLGLGQGKQKLFFLPEAHTDFIGAILGEELGLCGMLLLISAYVWLYGRLVAMALRQTERFSQFVVFGVALLLVVPALFNMAVVLALLPTKGLPLPLISYGGSNVVATLLGLGIATGLSRQDLHVGWTQKIRIVKRSR